jgi:hypothetical protein
MERACAGISVWLRVYDVPSYTAANGIMELFSLGYAAGILDDLCGA